MSQELNALASNNT
jgi:Reverse transcriptase (RNA-dependent DNA polymerase)